MSSVTKSPLKLAFLMASLCIWTGCWGPLLRNQPDSLSINEPVTITEDTLIGAVTQPYGLSYVKVEAVALVTGLAGTGEDPPPSPQRAALLGEMNRREVKRPNQVLASPDTALVVVRGFLQPGIQAGDRFDIEVRTPNRSSTTSLRGGQLLETRLSETAVLGDQIRKGHLLGVAKGPILVDPTADSEKEAALARQGRVLSGGVATKSRKLGLLINSEHQSVRFSQVVSKAVNLRFHSYIDGQQRGLATPKTDGFIELDIHPRYQDNIGRYMRVVRSIAISETHLQQQSRLQLLSDQLLDPVTSSSAAMRLEAIGNNEAIEILKQGLVSEDPEVRFYAAEALAYLDVTAAVETLAKAGRDESAFRIHCLAALSAMDDAAAYEALWKLLSVKSGETRYGAFRALTSMAPGDSLLRGEKIGDKFRFHILDVNGPPMIHATSTHKSEIVLFGLEHKMKLPLVLDAGPRITVNGLNGVDIKVSNFSETTQQRTVSNDVEEVIRAVVELGGDYPDVVQMLQQAKDTGALESRFLINALPESGREILNKNRESSTEDSDSESSRGFSLETPESEIFGKR